MLPQLRWKTIWFLLFAWVACITAACSPEGKMSTQQGVRISISPGTQTGASPLTHTFSFLHMVDLMNGWALLNSQAYRTSDGGVHWRKVGPVSSADIEYGTFKNAEDAWVAGVQIIGQEGQKMVVLYHTTDGGIHWQQSNVATVTDTGDVIDPPHFLNANEGWIDIRTSYSMGEGAGVNAVYHTVDGGQHWRTLADANTLHQGPGNFVTDDTGLSFKDAHTLYVATANSAVSPTGETTNGPPCAVVSSDGGLHWKRLDSPPLPSLTNANYTTTPPVFFGNYAVMPVYGMDSQTNQAGLLVTEDGGAHWSLNANRDFIGPVVYALDPLHIYSATGDYSSKQYADVTADGGKHWKQLGLIGAHVQQIDFLNPTYGYALTDTTVVSTNDGGQTWHPVNAVFQR